MYFFGVRFTVAEISGRSGATILEVKVTGPEASDFTGAGCWREPIHVEAGGTLHAFDADWESLGYCAPGTASRSINPIITVNVGYQGDDGQMASVSAQAVIVK
jgi:hypothetical protein